MSYKQQNREEIERRIEICEKYSQLNLTESTSIGNHAQLLELREIKDFIDSLPEEPTNEDLDYLVISLEETIGTSPHSREVIKEHLQRAAEWGRNHIEDKSEMVSDDLEEEIEFFWNSHDGSMNKFEYQRIVDCAHHFAEWQKEKDYKMYAHLSLKHIHDAWQELKNNKPDIENSPAICFCRGANWRENQMKRTLQTEYEKGRFDMREEMMKDAIDGKITLDLDGNISLDCSDVLYVGDKVKINKITMSKIAEQMALETYPKPAEEHSGFITKETFNVSKRIGYVKGYDQACSDIKSKVQDLIDGLRKNNPNPFGNESELMAASEIEALNMILDIIDKN